MAVSRSRPWRAALLLLVVGATVGGLQLVQPRRENPAEDFAVNFESVAEPSPELLSLVERACYDCHSHRTRWPWYSRISPVSWIIAEHVKQGRGHLNFSEWGKYSSRVRQMRLAEACQQVSGGNMPPPGHRLLRPETALTEGDVYLLCNP